MTRELTVPGFLHDQHSMAHIFIQANPLLMNDELGLLSRHGLRYTFPEMPFVSLFEDGTTLGLYRDRERNFREIERYSAKDAQAYLRFSEIGAMYLPMLVSTLYTPPMPVGASYAMMDQSREGRDLLAMIQKSSYDIITEFFEHEKVRIHFTRMVCENLVGPEEKGTGLGLFVFLSFLEKYGIGVPIGGSGTLTAALIRSIESNGGTVLANAAVERIQVKNGRAAGVALTDGREFAAKDAVIGAIHPHLLGRFVEGLDPAVTKAAEATQLGTFSCLTIHAALDEKPRFNAESDVGQAMMIELVPTSYNAMRKCFDTLRYGELPDIGMIGVGFPSNIDPTRAPAGKATMHAWDYVPADLASGEHWDDYKPKFVATMLERMRRFVPNLTEDNIIAYHSDSPIDMERTSPSFRKGDLHGIGPYMHQSGAHRPTPDLGNNTVPGVDRLYLVGPFQHPGGGVFGAGRATAIRMFDDLKLDFDKTAKRR